ncbi:hypothetical protein BsWGS_04073 [Bradybaena similaris]
MINDGVSLPPNMVNDGPDDAEQRSPIATEGLDVTRNVLSPTRLLVDFLFLQDL